jgi:hypothetical protein
LEEVRGLKIQLESLNKSMSNKIETQFESLNNSLSNKIESLNNSLSNKIECLTNKFESLNKSLTTRIDGLEKITIAGFDAVRNAFTGFPDLRNSSVRLVVSPTYNGNNEAQGTLVRSPRFNAGKGIIVSNKHVVIDAKQNCSRKVDAFALWPECKLNISKWIIFKKADVSIGILADDLCSGHQFLEVLPEADYLYSEDLWGRARKNGRHLALHGKIVSQNPTAPHLLITSVGGSRGFSGLGYANRDKLLTVIHTGAVDVNESHGEVQSNQTENGDEFSEISNVQENCMKGLRLAFSGMEGFIDHCLVVLKSSIESTSDRDRLNASMQSCKDGWEIHARGSTLEPTHFVHTCLELFTNQTCPLADQKKEMCKVGWKAASVKDSAFVEQCLELGDAEKFDKCRAGWLQDRDALVDECVSFVQLSARNPRARGLAAWVINRPHFDFIDVVERWKECS